MPKSKKYRKKPRGYKRKLANAPHLYNRNEPPHLGYAYNRTNQTYETLAFHRGNQRFQELEQLEALKRLKDRNGMQSSLMAENFKAIESAYYTGDRWKIGAELRGIKERMAPLTKSAPRTKAILSDEGVNLVRPSRTPEHRRPPPPRGGGRGGTPPRGGGGGTPPRFSRTPATADEATPPGSRPVPTDSTASAQRYYQDRYAALGVNTSYPDAEPGDTQSFTTTMAARAGSSEGDRIPTSPPRPASSNQDWLEGTTSTGANAFLSHLGNSSISLSATNSSLSEPRSAEEVSARLDTLTEARQPSRPRQTSSQVQRASSGQPAARTVSTTPSRPSRSPSRSPQQQSLTQ